MNSHHESDVERVLKAALTSETSQYHRPSPRRGSLAPPTTPPDAAPTTMRRMAIRRILVPTDFSPQARRALTYARCFAAQFGAELILLHITEPVAFAPPYCPVDSVAALQATRRKTAEEGLAGLVGAWTTPQDLPPVRCRTMVVEGDPAVDTDRVARECCADLIIIATHGYTGLNRLLMGSTTEKVVRHAPCPVLVVREKERDFVSIEPAPAPRREDGSPESTGSRH